MRPIYSLRSPNLLPQQQHLACQGSVNGGSGIVRVTAEPQTGALVPRGQAVERARVSANGGGADVGAVAGGAGGGLCAIDQGE